MRDISVRVSISALPICGTTTQLFSVNSGLDNGNGSGVVTSKPAARITFFDRASYKSFCSTHCPRAQLIRIAVGFIRASVLAFIRCIVSGAREQSRITKSLTFNNCSNVTRSTPSALASFSRLSDRFEYTIRCGLNGMRRLATSWAMRPKPTMPTVEFLIDGPHM